MFISHLKPPASSFAAREVLKDLDRAPHLLVLVEIEAEHFPERGAPPFARIVSPSDDELASSWFADVSEDGRRLHAYFPIEVPDHGFIEYGYGNRVFGRVPLAFEARSVARLDPKRLPKNVVRFDRARLEQKRR